MGTLVPSLDDQLTSGLTSLRAATTRDSIVPMTEVADETGDVRHRKKLVHFLSPSRHHVEALR